MYFTRAATALFAAIALGEHYANANLRKQDVNIGPNARELKSSKSSKAPKSSSEDCRPGTVLVDSTCEPIICGESTTLVGNECIANCGDETELSSDRSECIPEELRRRMKAKDIDEDRLYLVEGENRMLKSKGLSSKTPKSSSIIIQCGDGTELIENECTAICGEGTALNDAGTECELICTGKGCRALAGNFDERHLFSSLEGDELEKHIDMYDIRKTDNDGLWQCHDSTSDFHGKHSTYEQCIGSSNQLSTAPMINTEAHLQYKPWAVPLIEEASLLAENPGIWSIDNFISDADIERLSDLAEKYGKDLNMFGPCEGKKTRATNSAQPTENKVCLKISPEYVCYSSKPFSKCSTKTHAEDTAFVDSIFNKLVSMWSIFVGPPMYAQFEFSLGGTPPVDPHYHYAPMSLLLYLTDGGASTIFTNANVTVAPKKGKVLIWLNRYDDGKHNPMADHAVQAHPKAAGKRGVMLLDVFDVPGVASLE